MGICLECMIAAIMYFTFSSFGSILVIVELENKGLDDASNLFTLQFLVTSILTFVDFHFITDLF
jgi:hypothetical protein